MHRITDCGTQCGTVSRDEFYCGCAGRLFSTTPGKNSGRLPGAGHRGGYVFLPHSAAPCGKVSGHKPGVVRGGLLRRLDICFVALATATTAPDSHCGAHAMETAVADVSRGSVARLGAGPFSPI